MKNLLLKRVKFLCLVFLSLITACLIIEGFLSVIKYRNSPYSWEWNKYPYFQPNADRIFSLTKNYPTDGSHGTTNNNGFRIEPDHQQSEHPNNRNIIMVGDSFTFSQGVKDAHTYPVFSQNYLNELIPGNYFSIINAGIPGYGFDQGFIYIQEIIKKYPLDYIVWNININDFDDANEACLYKKINNGHFIKMPIFLQTLYLQGLLIRFAPAPLRDSRLINMLFHLVQGDHSRFTIGCTRSNKEFPKILEEGKAKLEYFIDHITSLAISKNIHILYTVVPSQAYFDPEKFNIKGYIMQRYYAILQILDEKKVTYLDLNREIADIFSPSILSARNGTKKTDLFLSQKKTDVEKTIGTPSFNISNIFFDDIQEPKGIYGWKHLSAEGNNLIGYLFADYFNKSIQPE